MALPVVLYGLYLVVLGLSFRCASRAIEPFADRSHVAVGGWIQRLLGSGRFFRARCRVSLFLMDKAAMTVRASRHGSGSPMSLSARGSLGFWLS
ncbi:MAG: hypothetical protein QW223_05335 [Candidatus Caldarchaeum sp.]